MRTIALANQKGGVGKTTTSVNLAVSLAVLGYKTLLVDLDPQGHATMAAGIDPNQCEQTLYDVMSKNQLPMEDILCPGGVDNLHVAPGNILLSKIDGDLAGVPKREFVLRDKMAAIQNRFDVCIIDCNPSLNILTLNGLVTSNQVMVPVQAHYYAMEGLRQLLDTFVLVKRHFNPQIRLCGILLTMVESGTLLCRDVEQQLRERFGQLVFKTMIHRNIRLAEAPSAGESVITYAPQSRGAAEYMALAREIIGDETKIRTTEEHLVHI